MAKIRMVEISNFRSIKKLRWLPRPGVNCLIGPGDSGKSSILEAIDLCLGARRSLSFCDADFHGLDASVPIVISLTIGDLDNDTKNLDTYGVFLRGFNSKLGDLEDEPDKGLETVVTLVMTVGSDLDPQWSLYSDRAKAASQTRNLTWGDRQKLAPTRIGVFGDTHLSWRRGSVLHRLADEKLDLSNQLAAVAREARAAFGNQAETQLKATLSTVTKTAQEVGVNLGDGAKALLDVGAVSFAGGAITLHDGDGVPLSGLGTGSTRLLVTALQRQAASRTGIILLDELEHGLEPHRVIRLVGLLGAKDEGSAQQAFVTTHSPTALREFSGDQLFIVRKGAAEHTVTVVGTANEIQGTIRKYPEAFLTSSVLVCEGGSEIGLVRGISRYLFEASKPSIEARGVALVDGSGGGPKALMERADVFRKLGYRSAVFMDSDVPVDKTIEEAFIKNGGSVFRWQDGFALEDALFAFLPSDAIDKLIERAIELHGENSVNSNITSRSNGAAGLKAVRAERATGDYSNSTRELLAKASKVDGKKAGKGGWFKTITYMEDVTFDILVPSQKGWTKDLKQVVLAMLKWADSGN